jgi:phosphatidylglycerophosphate synthase
MLDTYSLKLVQPWLRAMARRLYSVGIHANQVSLAGFVLGMLGVAAIAFQFYYLALFLILLNRCADGIDGELARQATPTDQGAYLDITLDFLFYSAVVFGFALADPGRNALAAAALIFSFIGTGSSFLAFAIMAERRSMKDLRLPDKGFYYLGGFAEGTETIIFFVLFCLFPDFFPLLAWVFAGICAIAAGLRIHHGYHVLR